MGRCVIKSTIEIEKPIQLAFESLPYQFRPTASAEIVPIESLKEPPKNSSWMYTVAEIKDGTHGIPVEETRVRRSRKCVDCKTPHNREHVRCLKCSVAVTKARLFRPSVEKIESYFRNKRLAKEEENPFKAVDKFIRQCK